MLNFLFAAPAFDYFTGRIQIGYNYASFGDALTDIGEKTFDGCSKLTMQGKQGTKAEEYAKKNNIKY